MCTALQADSIYTITEGQCLIQSTKPQHTGKNEIVLHSLYPNPAQQQLSVHFTLPAASETTISITSLDGKELNYTWLPHAKGEQHRQIPTANLSSGHYLLVLKAGNNVVSRRFAVQKQ